MAWARTGVQVADSDVVHLGLTVHVSSVIQQQLHYQQPIPLVGGNVVNVHAEDGETNTAATHGFDQPLVGIARDRSNIHLRSVKYFDTTTIHYEI